MKKFYFMAFMAVIVCLTGCNITDSISPLGPQAEDLKNNRGIVTDCKGETLNKKPPYPSPAQKFWKENDLPEGTTNFVCKDGKAYLLSKVTDCQGRNISQQLDGINQFIKDNQIQNWATIKFICINGKPQQWHKY